MLALLCLGSFGVFGQNAQEPGWKWQNPLPQGNYLSDVNFIDNQTGWAVDYGGTILKSTNSGSSWLIQNSGIPELLNSVQFKDSQTGWAVGYDGTILHTSSGGTTHIQKSIVSLSTFSIYPNPAEESFTLVGKGKILAVGLIDALGKEWPVEVYQENRMDIRSLKPGLYWVKIKTSSGVVVERLVKR
jgi:photosystem II stability/assembly factor-like uncharacterized protein